MVPRNLLFAHCCEVISIACAPDATADRPNIVSLAQVGRVEKDVSCEPLVVPYGINKTQTTTCSEIGQGIFIDLDPWTQTIWFIFRFIYIAL